MPPKNSLAATQRATADPVRDQWSANPFKSGDPRHEQYEVQQRIAQREAAVSRVGHTIAKDLRTHDFAMGGVVMGRSTTAAEFAATMKKREDDAVSRSTSMAADGSLTSPLSALAASTSAAANNTTASLTAVPGRLQPPTSYVEGTIPIEGLTCSAVLQGGSLVLVGTRDGDVVALNGFTNAQLAKVSVTAPIKKSDRELQQVARDEGRDDSKRPERKARRGDGEAHSLEMTARITGAANGTMVNEDGGDEADRTVTSLRDTSRGTARVDSEDKSGNEGAYPIAVAALGESSYVAFVLSNNKVRVFDAMTLVAVDEISCETEEEKANKKNGVAKKDDDRRVSTTSNDPSAGDDDKLPFAAVLPVDCALDPIIFFVACRDRIVALNLYEPEDLSDRPRLTIMRLKTYEKLGLRFVSAATDCARTIVYVGDDNGDMWSVDVNDLMVIDSWPVVPPPPAPPNTKKEQRKGAAAARLASPKRQSGERRELATAVGAFGEYIFAGTSAGRVVVSQKQSFGEKPLPILDEPAAHKCRIVGTAADERAQSVWFASEDGEVTCWSLTEQEITYRTTVPVSSGLITAFAMLPHAITNKIWTVTISGINKVWATEDHQTHDEMNVTHAHMEAVLSRQELAMQQKEDEVDMSEAQMLARLRKIVEAMAEQNRQRILRAYYCAWVTARLKAITRRKREDAAEALNNNAVYHLARSYYLKLIANMTDQRSRKQNEATIMHLRTQREDELRSRYFNSLRKFIHERKDAEHKQAMAVAVANINGSSSLLPFFMDRWRRFAETKHKAKQHQKHLQLIAKVEGRRTASHYFRRWSKAAEARRLREEQARSVTILGDVANFRLTKVFYNKWMALVVERRKEAQREGWVAFVKACAERALMQKAFAALQRYPLVRARAADAEAIASAVERNTTLETSYAVVAPLCDRRDKIAALKRRLAVLAVHKKQLLADEEAVCKHNAELRARIADRPNPILDSVPSGQRATLLKIMGRLRSLIIDSEKDAVVISKVLAKAKADTVMATFESYWSDLKAAVLVPPAATAVPTASRRLGADSNEASVISSSAAPAEATEWPRGEAAVMRVVADADAMQAPLLQTVKSVVIAFDAFSVSEVESLPAAEEVIANTEALVVLAELLQAAVAKKKADSPPPSPSRKQSPLKPRIRIVDKRGM